MTARRFFLACLCLLLALDFAVAGLGAQTDDIDDARRARELIREEKAELAGQLDPLLAENAELEAAVDAISQEVLAQQAALDATRVQLNQSRTNIELANDAVEVKRGEIADLNFLLTQQAVVAYVRPQDEDLLVQMFGSEDLTQGPRRRALLSTINLSEADYLDKLRAAESELEGLVGRAIEAEQAAMAQEVEETERLVKLEGALDVQRGLQDALNARIADFQAEIDGHAAIESEITQRINGLVAEEEARRWAEEQARIEAERAAQAAATAATQAEVAQGEPSAVALVEPPPPPAPSGAALIRPVGGPISSGFGPRWGRMHNGVDVSANTGTGVVAARGGTIVSAQVDGGYGNLVIIDHGDGMVTFYAHLSSFSVSSGQSVNSGQLIGAVGCTGSCTGPHLHFEVRIGGVPYDPQNYF